jgi:hypothetical protein
MITYEMRRNYYNDYQGDGFNIPKYQTCFDLANPNKDVSNILHHAHMNNVILSPKRLGTGFFPESRKSKK